MNHELMTQAAQMAVQRLDEKDVLLRAVYRAPECSNIWQVRYSHGKGESTVRLYVFSSFSLERIAQSIYHQLSSDT